MNKFKVGDIVVAKKNNGYGITTDGWTGIVKKVCSDIRFDLEGAGVNGTILYWHSLRTDGFELATFPMIVITTDGKKTTATKYENGKTTLEAIRRSPDDTFDFMTGAKLAFERLQEKEKEEKRDLRELLKNGVFGESKMYGYFVVVNGLLVFEKGGFNRIDEYDKRLKCPISPCGEEITALYDSAQSFDGVKYGSANTIWER